jgi:hypothetical protein
MATLTGPLLSFGASGQIAKTQVYSSWKGRPYARRLVVPSNPRSTEQTKTRTTFSFLNSVWKIAPADVQAPWTQFAKGQVLTNRNAWLQKNLASLRDQLTLDGLVLSPGAAGGLSVTPTLTGGAGDITIDAIAPSPLPAGWTIVKLVGAAILDQDPHSGTAFTIVAGSDSTSTYQVVLSGLDAGDYQAGAWFVFQRSALATDLAYGASIADVVTVT